MGVGQPVSNYQRWESVEEQKADQRGNQAAFEDTKITCSQQGISKMLVSTKVYIS